MCQFSRVIRPVCVLGMQSVENHVFNSKNQTFHRDREASFSEMIQS